MSASKVKFFLAEEEQFAFVVETLSTLIINPILTKPQQYGSTASDCNDLLSYVSSLAAVHKKLVTHAQKLPNPTIKGVTDVFYSHVASFRSHISFTKHLSEHIATAITISNHGRVLKMTLDMNSKIGAHISAYHTSKGGAPLNSVSNTAANRLFRNSSIRYVTVLCAPFFLCVAHDCFFCC